jgi:hypothetical protein
MFVLTGDYMRKEINMKFINLGNFSICAGFSTYGRSFGRFYSNFPEVGEWIRDFSKIDVFVKFKDEFVNVGALPLKECDLTWPNPHMIFEDLSVHFFSPISYQSVEISSLPIIYFEFKSELEYKMLFISIEDNKSRGKQHIFKSEDQGKTFEYQDDMNAVLTGKHIIYAFVYWDESLFITNTFETPLVMVQQNNYFVLREKMEDFIKSLPSLPRNYQIILLQEMFASIALTKLMKSGQVITLHYYGLNQRDSFWASFVHLAIYPSLERKMIEESANEQLPSGKIPTTILPTKDKDWDIDTTAYFVLRVVRFFRYHRDLGFGKEYHQYAQKAIRYLKSLLDQNHVPFARNFWADWKNVKGMKNRLYGPHFVLLVKAAFKEYNWMSRQFHFEEENTEINIEPLWNGEFFVDIFTNGQPDDKFHEDQIVPLLWNVVDRERVMSILRKAQSLEGEFGVPETYPFYIDTFGYHQGEFHNGGIFPWLSFVDASVRIVYGLKQSGEDLIAKVGKADINIDMCASEFIHGINGLNYGYQITGSNASCFLAFSLDGQPEKH